MRIGIITYYRVANFGANLQAISTYRFLRQAGHTPIFIRYMSRQLFVEIDGSYGTNAQVKAHLDFVDGTIVDQTRTCFTADDVNEAIRQNGIEALIIGSDAVLQHHPLRSRLHVKGRYLKRIAIDRVNDERRFPNLFWGYGITPSMKKSLMSASSQSSAYQYFSSGLKQRMNEALQGFVYISVRDAWTRQMLQAVTGRDFPLTPDPVFAFNQNAADLIPDREYILKKYGLPEDYVLVSFVNVRLPDVVITRLKDLFKDYAPCVALPSPLGIRFKHSFDYEIPMPLCPADWYALIKYSRGYIGNNMHPVVVALHNGVPCFSVDNYSRYDFWGRPQDDGASKIEDILRQFHLEANRVVPAKGNSEDLAETIYNRIMAFPKEEVVQHAAVMYEKYIDMMSSIMKALSL